MSEAFLRTDQLMDRWRGAVKKQTLVNWRVQGKGPKFTRIGRSVLYALSDVELYEQSQTFASRAEEIENERDQDATTRFTVIE